jgi:penicillin-binding protein 2
VLALAVLGLAARLWYLQIAHGDDYLRAAVANHTRIIREESPRGVILDNHGQVIASNRSQFAVYAQPTVATDDLTLRRLGEILKLDPNVIKSTILTNRKNDYDPIRVALDVSLSVVTQVSEQRPYLPGVQTSPEPVRWYREGDMLGNTIGTLGRIDPNQYKALQGHGYFADDFVGRTGLEAQYEQYLHGTPGGTQVQVDAQGHAIAATGEHDPVPGDTLVLSVDQRVQKAAQNAFAAHNFVGGAVAVNPQTGAVLAMASAPDYDPNMFATGIKTADWERLNTDPRRPMINRAVDALYPPGSTFKQVVAAAGLQTGAITTQTTTFCPGYMMLGRAKFRCWEVHDDVDFYKAVEQSCDVFFYQCGLRMGPTALSAIARQYSLAQATGIDLPHEMIGSIPSPAWKAKRFERLGTGYSNWFGGDTLNMSIGQGYVLVTPLQMALVTATTCNKGYVLRPYLVQKILRGTDRSVVLENSRTVYRRIPVDQQYLDDVVKAMRLTVTNGTGKIVDLPGVNAGAKTGSAQIHGNSKTHGWFVAFAPVDHPTIACAAVVEHGGHGADSAGYVVRAMLEAYFGLPVDLGGNAGRSD